MDLSHANPKHMPHCGMAGGGVLRHRRNGHAVASGKCSEIAVLNLLPRVIAGI